MRPEPPVWLASVGAGIRSRREARGWSIRDLAGAAKLSVTGLWEIEKGRNLMGVDTLMRLADALGVSCDELLGRNHGPFGLDGAGI